MPHEVPRYYVVEKLLLYLLVLGQCNAILDSKVIMSVRFTRVKLLRQEIRE